MEHLLVMPVRQFEIMMSKVWAMGLLVLVASAAWVQVVMLAAPDTHYVMLAQAILYRGAGLDVVWPQFAAPATIGTVLFGLSLARFRKTLETMA